MKQGTQSSPQCPHVPRVQQRICAVERRLLTRYPVLTSVPSCTARAAANLRGRTETFDRKVSNVRSVPLVHEVYRQVARFHARPLGEKLKIKLDEHNVGYLPM